MHTMAWYHLREAATMILMSNMHQEQTYQKWDAVEAPLRRRLFWLVFVAERYVFFLFFFSFLSLSFGTLDVS